MAELVREALEAPAGEAGASIDQVPVAVWVTAADGLLVRWNRRAAALLRRARDLDLDPPARPLRWLARGGAELADERTPHVLALRAGGALEALDLELEVADGSRIALRVDVDLLRDEQGAVSGVIHAAHELEPGAPALASVSSLTDQRIRTVLGGSSISWSSDAEGGFRSPQPSWEAYTGQPWPEHAGAGWLAMLHPDDRARKERDWTRTVAEQRESLAEERVWHAASASYRVCLCRASPVFDDTGRLCEWIGLLTDIDERHRADKALRESEASLRELADALPLVVWTASGDGRPEAYNQRWFEYTGLSRERSAEVESWRTVLHAEDVEDFFAAWSASVRSGEPFSAEYRFRHAPSGTWRWQLGRAVPVRDEEGTIVRWIGTSTDIDEQKRAEQRLRESEQHYRLIGESIPCGVWIADAAGRLSFLSSDFVDLYALDVTRDGVRGLTRRMPPQDVARSIAAWRACVASGTDWEIEHRLRAKDGSWHVVLSRGRPVRGADGKIRSWVGIHLDISERKRLELELEQAKNAAEGANLAKDRFLAVLSHELRTPLTPVLMVASSLEGRADLPPGVNEEIGTLRRNVELEARLIDDLLDLTRITRGKLELRLATIDLARLLQETVRICSSDFDAKGTRLVLELDLDLAPVEADAARLQQTFWNLLKNAVKFTPAGGEIVVRARNRPVGMADPAVGTADVAAAVEVEVEDDGIGIDAPALPRIFDAFEQSEPAIGKVFGGLGLGLAISKALIEFHGGSICAESRGRGHGAKFTVVLPLRQPARAGVRGRLACGESLRSPAEETRPDHARGLSILCVEDHPDTARLIRQLLAARGYTVEIAGTVAAALACWERGTFDLLLSDLGLPDRSGLELMRELRERSPSVVGIALSGYGAEEDVEACREAGFAEHLIKPVNMRELEGAIVRLSARVR